MNQNQNPDARFAGDPASIVALARALLNIHPDHSTVVIALDGDGRVLVTMRADLTGDPIEQTQTAATYVASLMKVRAVTAITDIAGGL